jgi:predicted aspartyl protease
MSLSSATDPQREPSHPFGCGAGEIPFDAPAAEYTEHMSLFRVNVVARNPKDESLETPPIEALVDTGSELTWLPADILATAGITTRRKRTFVTATRQMVVRDVGYAILAAEGFETTDEVVFAEASDLILLGVRTIEGFGVLVDNVGHRFVAQASIVASVCEPEVQESAAGSASGLLRSADPTSRPSPRRARRRWRAA